MVTYNFRSMNTYFSRSSSAGCILRSTAAQITAAAVDWNASSHVQAATPCMQQRQRRRLASWQTTDVALSQPHQVVRNAICDCDCRSHKCNHARNVFGDAMLVRDFDDCIGFGEDDVLDSGQTPSCRFYSSVIMARCFDSCWAVTTATTSTTTANS